MPEYTLKDKSDSTTGSERHINHYSYNLDAIPAGFIAIAEGNDSQFTWIEYRNEEEAVIFIRFGGNLSLVNNVDTENADYVEPVSIHGYEGFIIEKGNNIQIVWADVEKEIFIDLICTGIARETAISIALNM